MQQPTAEVPSANTSTREPVMPVAGGATIDRGGGNTKYDSLKTCEM